MDWQRLHDTVPHEARAKAQATSKVNKVVRPKAQVELSRANLSKRYIYINCCRCPCCCLATVQQSLNYVRQRLLGSNRLEDRLASDATHVYSLMAERVY